LPRVIVLEDQHQWQRLSRCLQKIPVENQAIEQQLELLVD